MQSSSSKAKPSSSRDDVHSLIDKLIDKPESLITKLVNALPTASLSMTSGTRAVSTPHHGESQDFGLVNILLLNLGFRPTVRVLRILSVMILSTYMY